jgi:aspartate kinase
LGRRKEINMRVYKFGGASVKDAEGVRNMAAILQGYTAGELIVVVSAMSKTTNRLERLTSAWHQGDHAGKQQLYQEIKQFHTAILTALLPERNGAQNALSDLFNGLWETLTAPPPGFV